MGAALYQEADALARGVYELEQENKRLRGWLKFIEGSAGLTAEDARQCAGAALEGKSAPNTD